MRISIKRNKKEDLITGIASCAVLPFIVLIYALVADLGVIFSVVSVFAAFMAAFAVTMIFFSANEEAKECIKNGEKTKMEVLEINSDDHSVVVLFNDSDLRMRFVLPNEYFNEVEVGKEIDGYLLENNIAI